MHIILQPAVCCRHVRVLRSPESHNHAEIGSSDIHQEWFCISLFDTLRMLIDSMHYCKPAAYDYPLRTLHAHTIRLRDLHPRAHRPWHSLDVQPRHLPPVPFQLSLQVWWPWQKKSRSEPNVIYLTKYCTERTRRPTRLPLHIVIITSVGACLWFLCKG